MILVVDNYDSFVYNLGRYFRRLGQAVEVVRHSVLDLAAIEQSPPEAIVLSPGPGRPEDMPRSLQLIERLYPRVPILGVCLGHQMIGAVFGARIIRAPAPVHGQASAVFHSGRGIFAGLSSPFEAGRYHSLVIDRSSLPDCFEVTAETEDGLVMAIEHRVLPLVGLQFHPESILTELGYPILASFLRRAGLKVRETIPSFAEEAPPTGSA